MPRMRTLKKAIEELKEKDPDTALSEYALRQLVRSGEIPSVSTGGKYLVNMDALERFLSGL